MSCNSNSRALLSALTTMILIVSSFQIAQAQCVGECDGAKQAIRSDSWDVIPANLNFAIHEGSYRGRGRVTGHHYQLHLLQYMNDPEKFIAVQENSDTKQAWLGFLAAASDSPGVYGWYPIQVRDGKGGQSDGLDVRMHGDASFRFSYVVRPGQQASLLLGEPTGNASDLESVEYDEARTSLLQPALHTGKWCRSMRSGMEELVTMRADATLTKFTLNLVSEVTFPGVAMQVFPGVYAVRSVERRDYRTLPSREIRYVAVAINGYSSGLFGFASEPYRIYLFSRDGKHLNDWAFQYKSYD